MRKRTWGSGAGLAAALALGTWVLGACSSGEVVSQVTSTGPTTSAPDGSAGGGTGGEAGTTTTGGGAGGAGAAGGSAGAAGEGGGCNPAAPELCNGLDDNCNGDIDEGDPESGEDCDSGLPGECAKGKSYCQDGEKKCLALVTPGTVAEECNGLDDDCDGEKDNGDPGGGAECATGLKGICATGVEHCIQGVVSCEPDHAPGEVKEQCNDLDDDCNGFIDEGVQKLTFFKDNDGDGFGGVTTTLACSPPPGYVADGGDCNDFNKDINPKAPEVCNDVDDNCNGFPDDGVPTQKIYKDNDADGFAAKNAQSQDKCNVPVGWTLEKDWNGDKVSDWDCNDSDVTMYPGAVELCDGKDNDCNGQADSQCPTACAGFPVSIAGASGWSSILLYDVNADGTLEIQAGSSLVKPDGSVLASGFPGNDAQMTDVDLDGVAEFIFGDGLYRFQGGAFVKVLALPNAAGLKTAVGDVDADGVVDLVRDNGAGLAVVRLAVQGSTISIKSTTNIAAPPPSGVTQSFPALLVDADANNTLEIFFGSGTSPNKLDGRLFVYKQDGAQYDPSKFVTNEQNSYCGGGDCIPLFFYSAGSPFISYSNVASQYVFDLAGKQVSKKSGEAMDLLDVSLSGTVTPAANYGTLVDVDGDGTLELLQSVYGQGWGVQRWNAGKKSWEWMDPYPLLAAQGPYRGPNAADVDNDNMLDVFYVSSDVKLHCYHLGPKSWGPDRMWWNRWLGLNDGLAAVNGLDTFESPTNAPAAMSKARYYRAMIAYSGDTDVFRYVYKSSLMGQFGGVPKGKSYILEIWNDDEYLDPGKKPVATFTNSGFSYSPGGGNPPAPAHHYSFKVYGKTAGDWHSSDPYYVMVKPW